MNSFIASFDNNLATLTADESWHCTKVLRNKIGDVIRVIDGKGAYADASIEHLSEKKVLAKIVSAISIQKIRSYRLHLAIAPTKQIDRLEWMIEKMVEIGVDEISFLICHYSERKLIKTDRIQKIVESAVKQSLQAYIPIVNEPMPFKPFVQQKLNHQKFIAHCLPMSNKTHIGALSFNQRNNLVLIGPEGDFSMEEVEEAEKNGYVAIDLGNTRLRTETAGLYACMAVSLSKQ